MKHPIAVREFLEHLEVMPLPISSSDGIRYVLRRDQAVRNFAEAIRSGSIDEPDIRQLVSGLLSTFRTGERFQYSVELAAIAVALEGWHAPYADEYISDLSRLRLSELEPGPSVARSVLQARRADTQQSQKSTSFKLLRGGLSRERHYPILEEGAALNA